MEAFWVTISHQTVTAAIFPIGISQEAVAYGRGGFIPFEGFEIQKSPSGRYVCRACLALSKYYLFWVPWNCTSLDFTGARSHWFFPAILSISSTEHPATTEILSLPRKLSVQTPSRIRTRLTHCRRRQTTLSLATRYRKPGAADSSRRDASPSKPTLQYQPPGQLQTPAFALDHRNRFR